MVIINKKRKIQELESEIELQKALLKSLSKQNEVEKAICENRFEILEKEIISINDNMKQIIDSNKNQLTATDIYNEMMTGKPTER